MPDFKVMEIGLSHLDGKRLFKITRWPTQPGDGPFSFCDHRHEEYGEAEQCRELDYGMKEPG